MDLGSGNISLAAGNLTDKSIKSPGKNHEEKLSHFVGLGY